MDYPKVYMNTNEEDSDIIFNGGVDEYSNVLTQDKQMDIYYFIDITIPPLARAQYMMLRNIHMEI